MPQIASRQYHRMALATILLLSLFAFYGCNGAKKGNALAAIEIEGDQLSLTDLYAQLADTKAKWNDVYLPISLSVSQPANSSISGRATMVRGEYVHISLRVMGVEGAVIRFTADSAFFVDKYHKLYVAESLADLFSNYPMSISNIQDLLLGQAFMPGSDAPLAEASQQVGMYFSADSTDVWVIEPAKAIDGVDWWCTATESVPPMLESVSMLSGQSTQVDFLYSDQYETPAGIAAAQADIFAAWKTHSMLAQVRWDLEAAKWNSRRTATLKKPGSDYRRVRLADLIKSMTIANQ